MPSKFCFSVVFFFACVTCCAQPVKDEPVQIKKCSININANLFTATTEVELELFNPNPKVLDGEYTFSMQAGQVITSFALDINGKYRDGVIVDKQQGRVAYENTIRRRIDPGLLEMTTGNNYRLRVYPMPAKGIRKARITISQLQHVNNNAIHYILPLNINYNINEIQVNCTVTCGDAIVTTSEGILYGREFKKVGSIHYLSFSKSNSIFDQPISFTTLLSQKLIFSYSNDVSKKIFAIHVKAPDNDSKPKPLQKLTVFWDVSSSSRKRDIKKELDFLYSFISQRNVKEITLVTFSNAIQEIKNVNTTSIGLSQIKKFIELQQADGGTQLGVIDCTKDNTDCFLLFSDGLSNFGGEEIKTSNKPIYCINSSMVANHSLLKMVSTNSGGDYVDLSTSDASSALRQISNSALDLLSLKQDGNSVLLNIVLPKKSSGWITLTGELQSNKDLILGFGKEGQVDKEMTVAISNTETLIKRTLDTASLLQAYETISGNLFNAEAKTAFEKYHHFVGHNSSFIVLDNVDDYIEFGIEPPADLQEAYAKKLYVVKQKQQALKEAIANEEINNLKRAASHYNDRLTWWGQTKSPIDVNKLELKIQEAHLQINKTENENKTEPGNSNNNFQNQKFSQALNEVVVIGYGTMRRKSITGSVAVVQSRELLNYQSIPQALQGRVAGIQVISSGSPGSADRIFIRGANSLSMNSEPLYILDGMPIDGDIMNNLNVNDIESVTVIKDAASAAIYGTRAANGAILITTKRGIRNNYAAPKNLTKYKDLEDEDYVTELKEENKSAIYQAYLQKRDSFETDAAFYFDVAQLLFESGDKEKAVRVLSNTSEMDMENHQLLRAMGYVFEQWKMYEEAINVYSKVLAIKEEEPQSYRDLALAYERNGNHQQAIDILYRVITKNFYQYEQRYAGIKSLLLNEMNAIIERDGKSLDLSSITDAVIKPLPVDMRIVVDWNKDETDLDLHIIEPNGEECFYRNKLSKNGGRLSEDFTQGYGPEEYEIKNVQKGKYSIQVNYFGDRYQKQQVPSFIKLTIYKNFGKPNQTVQIETFLMNKQSGKIEIAEVKF